MLVKQIHVASAILFSGASGFSREQTLKIHSALNGEASYTNFATNTGIKIYRVDAARLLRGESKGLFQPIKSKVLHAAIPAQYQGKASAWGDTPWSGFSTRARVIVDNQAKIQKDDMNTCEELRDPKSKSKSKSKSKLSICSGSHLYNWSLFGAGKGHVGKKKAEGWLKGMANNRAGITKTAILIKSKA